MLGETKRRKRGLGGGALSLFAHVGIVVFLLAAPAVKTVTSTAAPKVTFFSLPPPPPPPPQGPKPRTRRPKKKPNPTPVLTQPDPDPVKPKQYEKKEKEDRGHDSDGESNPKGQEGGVPGGVEGGVVGGVPGGVVGGKGEPKAPPKPKNVPEFVIKKDVIQQDRPRLSEVFKQSHRGAPPMSGLYDVCVGLDGHVYRVTPINSVPGADDDIIRGITDGWLYKPQQVPVCFKWKITIEIK